MPQEEDAPMPTVEEIAAAIAGSRLEWEAAVNEAGENQIWSLPKDTQCR